MEHETCVVCGYADLELNEEGFCEECWSYAIHLDNLLKEAK